MEAHQLEMNIVNKLSALDLKKNGFAVECRQRKKLLNKIEEFLTRVENLNNQATKIYKTQFPHSFQMGQMPFTKHEKVETLKAKALAKSTCEKKPQLKFNFTKTNHSESTRFVAIKSQASQKVPKFLMRMEKRHEERIKRWSDIRTRKERRRVEERNSENQLSKKKDVEIPARKDKKVNSNEREKKLIKDTKEIRPKHPKNILNLFKLSEDHYYRSLLIKSFTMFKHLTVLGRAMARKAENFNEKRLLAKTFIKWKYHIKNILHWKEKQANLLYKQNLQKKCLKLWKKEVAETRELFLVASDWNELKVLKKYFKKWLTFTSKEQLKYVKLTEFAQLLFDKKLKSKCFNVLRQYPKLRISEIIAQARKSFWKNKVERILPDYNQPCYIVFG